MSHGPIALHTRGVRVEIGPTLVAADLDLNVNPGEIWAMLGENGVGKSTLLATLAGRHRATAGAVLLDATPLHGLDAQSHARRLAWLPQLDSDPFPATVLEQVLMGRHPYIERLGWESEEDVAIARRALADVGLIDFDSRDVTRLSGGERRRVALATVLAQQTPVLLLDEPLAQLDLRHQLEVLRHLQALARERRTVMFVTHDPNHAARFATHALLLLGSGRVLAGAARDVLNAPTLSELYRCDVRELHDGEDRVFVPAGG